MFDSIRSTPGWQRILLVGVGVVCIVIVMFGVHFSIVGWSIGPCDDDLALNAAQVDFSISYDNESESVTIRHQEGDTLYANWTEMLVVAVDAGDSDTTAEYVLANSSDEFPIATGDQVTVKNVTVSGRTLSDGDLVRIVQYGTERHPIPEYCPNSDPGPVYSNTVSEQTVQ